MKKIRVFLWVVAAVIIISGCSSIHPEIKRRDFAALAIHVENPDKKFFLEKIAIFQDMIATQDDLSVNERLELYLQGIKLYKSALCYDKTWNASEKYRLQGELVEVQRIYFGVKTETAINLLLKELNIAKRADSKLSALNKILVILKREQERTIWNVQEKYNLQQRFIEVKKEKSDIEKKFDNLLQIAKLRLTDQRKNYVSQKSKSDLQTANRYYEENNNKYFNWYIFGYSRNNMSIMRKAWSLCRRIRESEYSGYLLKCQAVEIQNKLAEIMRSSQIETCKSFPVLMYKDMYDFPMWDPEEKAEEDFIKGDDYSPEKIKINNVEKMNLSQL